MKRCHDVIRDNENLSPLSAFSVMSKILYVKRFDEISTTKGHIYQFQVLNSEPQSCLIQRVQELYKRAIGSRAELFDSHLGITRPETLMEITRLLGPLNFSSAQSDAKGEAYQSFFSKVMRGTFGQYFTPREVVRPMVEMISPKENERVIDPCCGTGGFLIYSSQFLREKSVKTSRRLVVRKRESMSGCCLTGIEVDRSVAESCAASMALEEVAQAKVVIVSALADFDEPILEDSGIEREGFDVVLTNPPFGKKTRLTDVSKRYRLSKDYKTPPFEALLIERSLDLLKPGGRCAIVLPDIALTNKPLLDFLYANAIVQGVVSLPPETFRPHGPSVKTSVLFFKKKVRAEEETSKVFMGRVDQIGYDSTGRKAGENRFVEIALLFRQFLEDGSVKGKQGVGDLVFVKDSSNSEIFANLRVEAYDHHLEEMGKLVPLKEVATVIRGYTPAWNDYTKEGIPILKVKNLHNQNIDFCFERRGHVSTEIYEAHPGARVQLGDILLTASAHSPEYIAKKIDIVDSLPFEKCMAVSELIIIRANPHKIDPYFLVSLLRKAQINEQFRACIRGTTAHIYPCDVERKVLVPVVPLFKQRRIGSLLREALSDFRRFESRYHNFDTELDGILAA